jgi:carboxylesterase type B
MFVSLSEFSSSYFSLLPVILLVREGARGGGASDQREAINAAALAEATRAVVVTENHRVGVLGFFSPNEGFTSNLGLLDLAAALIFVQEVLILPFKLNLRKLLKIK